MQARRDATGCKLAHRAKGCVYLTLQYSSHENQPRTFVIKLAAAGGMSGPCSILFTARIMRSPASVCIWLYVKMWERRGYDEICSSYFRASEDARMLFLSYFQQVIFTLITKRRLSKIGKSWLDNLIHGQFQRAIRLLFFRFEINQFANVSQNWMNI